MPKPKKIKPTKRPAPLPLGLVCLNGQRAAMGRTPFDRAQWWALDGWLRDEWTTAARAVIRAHKSRARTGRRSKP